MSDQVQLSARAQGIKDELTRRKLLGSFREWCTAAMPVVAPMATEPQRHHLALISALEDVERGDTKRLIVALPRGAAKTTYGFVLFTPWFLARGRARTVLGASATADFAEFNSGRIVRLIEHAGARMGLRLESNGVQAWRTSNDGHFKASGVGAQIVGRRSNLVLVDDPFPSRKFADSESFRDDIWNWFLSDVYGTLTPDARVVIIGSRYHEDDLVGRLLRADPGAWRVLSIPAVAGANDPLGRQPGEWLWDDDPRYAFGEDLRRKYAELERNGALREWQSNYQQDPRPGEGAIFKTAHIGAVANILESRPEGLTLVRAWDFAGTAQSGRNNPDFTVGALLGVAADGKYAICDIKRFRDGPDGVERRLLETAAEDGADVVIKLNQDPAQAGKFQVLYLTRQLSGYKVVAERETGKKEVRAEPFASQVNVGNVRMVRAAWNPALMDEMAAFPSGAHEDQIDALTAAFSYLVSRKKRPAWLDAQMRSPPIAIYAR